MPKIDFTICGSLKRSIDLSELEGALSALARFFGQETTKIVPTCIEQPPQAHFIVRFANKLKEVCDADGFQEHLLTYRDGIGPSFFTTCLAAHLKKAGASLRFEPPTRNGRKADILAHLDAEATFECKAPAAGPEEFADEHQKIFEALLPYVDTPHTVTLRYRNPLQAADLQELGRVVKSRLSSMASDGVIFSREGLEVSLDSSMDPAVSGFRMQLSLIAPDPEDGTILPGHAIVSRGRKLAIYGPAVPVKNLIKARLRKASKQAPVTGAFVVAISSRTLMGSPRDHRLAVIEEFQPTQFTRVSGVVLADFPVTLKGEEEAKVRFFSNPYSKFPLSERFRALLGEDSPHWPSKPS